MWEAVCRDLAVLVLFAICAELACARASAEHAFVAARSVDIRSDHTVTDYPFGFVLKLAHVVRAGRASASGTL